MEEATNCTDCCICSPCFAGCECVDGAQIVYSGLKPGVITLHMLLAILMLCVLVFVAWAGCDRPWKLPATSLSKGMGKIAVLLFVLVVVEGLLGSQIREKTDELKKTHPDAPRSEWVGELEQSPTYLVHRSGSWLVLIVAGCFYLRSPHAWSARAKLEGVVLGTVVAQMILGLVLFPSRDFAHCASVAHWAIHDPCFKPFALAVRLVPSVSRISFTAYPVSNL